MTPSGRVRCLVARADADRPPIIDIGRNTGSQSATLVIRAMDVGDVQPKWRDLWFKLTAAVG